MRASMTEPMAKFVPKALIPPSGSAGRGTHTSNGQATARQTTSQDRVDRIFLSSDGRECAVEAGVHQTPNSKTAYRIKSERNTTERGGKTAPDQPSRWPKEEAEKEKRHIPPRMGARLLTAEIMPDIRVPLGELRIPLKACHMAPPKQPRRGTRIEIRKTAKYLTGRQLLYLLPFSRDRGRSALLVRRQNEGK